MGTTSPTSRFDFCIAGAGIIGLSLALELQMRGASVLVLERGNAMREASWAAGGMLAALDPANPPELQPLARLSLQLYPEFLARVAKLSGHLVPIRTTSTLLASPASDAANLSTLTTEELRQLAPALDSSGFSDYRWALLDEPSLDPRDLCTALPLAIRGAHIEMREETAWLSTEVLQGQGFQSPTLQIQSSAGTFLAGAMVHCTGAWAASAAVGLAAPMVSKLGPRKGQMLCMRLPADTTLTCVVHAPGVYIVPRGDGRVVIGSTIEDCGFDKTVSDAAMNDLLARATKLIPALGRGTVVERWAGLRPGSLDSLPVLGAIAGAPGSYIAAGHFRMGVLLAPATARVMAQLLTGETPAVNLLPFAPHRLAA